MYKLIIDTFKKTSSTYKCTFCVFFFVTFFLYSGGLLGNIWTTLPQQNKPTGSTKTTKNMRYLKYFNVTNLKHENKSFVYSTSDIFDTIIKIKDRNCREMEMRLGNSQNDMSWKCRGLAECNNGKGRVKGSLPIGCDHRLPKAILVGVDKAGTRELIDFLAMHPGIVIRRYPYYEISFFSSTLWKNGLDWYRKRMPRSLESQITMEKSPAYFLTKETPIRIKQMDPNIKLILIVRNPVERTISRWTFGSYTNFNLTLDNVKDSVRKLAEELKHDVPNDLSVKALYKRSALRGSIYDIPFENYLEHFNRSQIHVVDSEKFKHDPYKVLYSIEDFLGLDHCINKTDFAYNDEKKFYCLRDPGFHNISVCFGDERGRPKPAIPDMEAIKSELRKVFDPHNLRFYNISGINLHWE